MQRAKRRYVTPCVSQTKDALTRCSLVGGIGTTVSRAAILGSPIFWKKGFAGKIKKLDSNKPFATPRHLALKLKRVECRFEVRG